MITLMLLDMLFDLPLQQGVALLDGPGGLHHESFGDLAFAVGRYTDDDDVGDGGVREEVRLELGGGDLEALYFDESGSGSVSKMSCMTWGTPEGEQTL